MKKMLYVFREFNDLDHMTPVLDQALTLHPEETIITCINPNLDLKDDFRLKYLQSKYNVKVQYIYDLYCNSLGLKLFSRVTNRILFSKSAFSIVASLKQKLRNKLYNCRLKIKLFNELWFQSLIQKHNIGAVIVDYGSKHKFIYETISNACHVHSIPIIGMPHGMDATTNNFVSDVTHLKQDTGHLEKTWGWINNFIVASEGIKQKYSKEGLPLHSMKVLGNPRFAKSWHDKYRSIINVHPSNIKGSKLKIIFFDHGSRYRVNTDNIYATLKSIDQLPYTDLVIKPHTRELLSDHRLTSVGRTSSEHSIHLINWADVVINHLSSIVFDAYHLNKIFIYPNYFTENSMVWEKYNACWAVSNINEMIDAITSIHTGKYQLPYRQKHVDKLLNDQVYGNQPDTNISLLYLNHIKSIINT